MFACRTWGLRATDVMQGVVLGTRIDEMGDNPYLLSRLDFDQCFGTVINRFCCQAVIGHPLTVYGQGGQTRGLLPLRDSMQCLTIAIENPPSTGEYRVFNQFEDCYSVEVLAQLVREVAQGMEMDTDLHHYDNPRKESEQHYYNPDRNRLINLGYQPSHDIRAEIRLILQDLIPHQGRIIEKQHILVPDIRWDSTRRRSEIIDQELAPSH
jgi:UDP-sulfoquinovose synthase